MRGVLFVFALAGCAGLCGCIARPSDNVDSLATTRPSQVSTVQLSASTRPVPVGVRIVELRGDPVQIGTEHGRQCGDTIHLLYDRYLNVAVTGPDRFKASLAALVFVTQMLPEHQSELAALGDSVGLSQADVALAQCFLDLSAVTACSTITLPASAAPDGVARFGRNLDFPSLNIADKHSVVFIYHPNGRYQFAAIGWPGMIGVLSGMNEYGLCLSNMEVSRSGRPPTAMPYTLLYRMVLEQCRTVDEAIALLEKTPRQTANNLMLMDSADNRAVAEIRPEGVTVRRGTSSAPLISTNHQRGQDTETAGYCWRYDALHADATSRLGRIDTKTMEWMLGKVVQGSHGDMTLQSMIFEPSSRVVYLAVGANAPSHHYERIDLSRYFAIPAK